ncbi:hypothetical protein [Salinarimonas sp.]|uniref:hypothetical protein n=1 Tax=Salinarimonas sp. TaxID=2766526 RepID=UPI00391A7151
MAMLLRTPSADRPHLVACGVEDALRRLLTAFTMLGANGAGILQQPDLSLKVLPTLPEDQALVRGHVRLYADDTSLSGGILACMQAVATIANQIVAMCRGLLPAAATLDDASADDAARRQALAQFQAGITELRRVTTSLDADSHSAALPIAACATALSGFLQNQIADDAARFAAAKEQAAKAGPLDAIEAQIDALQTHIDQLCGEIAAGATSQIPQALAFGFTIGKAVATATTAGPLVVAVLFSIKDEVGTASKFADEMRRKNAELDDYIAQYEALIVSQMAVEQELAVLATIAGGSAVFRDNLAAARDVVGLLMGDIRLLSNGMLYLSSVETGLGAGWFTAQLNEAVAAWTAIGDTVTQQLALARSLADASGES